MSPAIGDAGAETNKRAGAQPAGLVVPESLETFSRDVLGRPLRRYQREVAEAIQESIWGGLGHTFTVMMARQMGKNELSAHLEAWLLLSHAVNGGTIVKAAPTFRPQIAHSMRRLEGCLRRPEVAALLEQAGIKWKREGGNTITVGEARALFFSAEPGANVVGATASLLLEIDEAQHVDAEKYTRDFRPMASSTNATTVLYGTAWREGSLLEEEKRRNVEEEARGEKRRHFQFDWQVAVPDNERYGQFVEREVARLGRDHPIIRTQYYLEPLGSGGGFFDDERRLLLRGTHPRQLEPVAGSYYVAGVDVAGAAEEAAAHGVDATLREALPRKDSTVAGIAEVTPGDGGYPMARLVQVYWWTGRPLHEQCEQLIRLLRDQWRCRRIAVDASGLGADLAERLRAACARDVVEPVVFSVQTKSRLAYHLHSHVAAARLQMWEEPDAGKRSPEATELWKEVELARTVPHSGGLLGFAVPEHQGHDDFVTMLALLSWAAREVRPEAAHTFVSPPPMYTGRGRY